MTTPNPNLSERLESYAAIEPRLQDYDESNALFTEAAQAIRDLEAKVADKPVAWRWRFPKWPEGQWSLTEDPTPHPRHCGDDGTDLRVIEPLYALQSNEGGA